MMTEETDAEFYARVRKAAKVSAVAVACIVGVVGVIVGLFILAGKLGELLGLILAGIALVFVWLWFCAMIDLRPKGDNK